MICKHVVGSLVNRIAFLLYLILQYHTISSEVPLQHSISPQSEAQFFSVVGHINYINVTIELWLLKLLSIQLFIYRFVCISGIQGFSLGCVSKRHRDLITFYNIVAVTLSVRTLQYLRVYNKITKNGECYILNTKTIYNGTILHFIS